MQGTWARQQVEHGSSLSQRTLRRRHGRHDRSLNEEGLLELSEILATFGLRCVAGELAVHPR